jgi:hypothetical protein
MTAHPTPHAASATGNEPVDDLSLIRHVGPGTIKRLQEGGVTTLAAIAAATSDELAGASGYSATKIDKEDWIGQARRLTGASEPSQALVVAPRADPSHRVVTFRLELTVEPGGNVHHSDITYLQDDSQHDHWPDWDTERLTGFVRHVAGLDRADTASDTADAVSTDPTGGLPAGPVIEPASYRLELHSTDGEVSDSRAVTHNDTVDVVIDVPLRGLVTRPTRPVRHRVEVTAVEIGGGQHHLIATSSATEQHNGGELNLRIPASMPPAGLYRLRAAVTVASTDAKATSTSARLRSGPILVR